MGNIHWDVEKLEPWFQSPLCEVLCTQWLFERYFSCLYGKVSSQQ